MKPELMIWLAEKLFVAEKALEGRRQAAKTWSGGTEKSWRDVGSSLTKAQRLAVAAKEDRIAVRCIREVEMFKAVIVALEATP